MNILDEDGDEVEDPVSLAPIPVAFAIVLDTRYYDVRAMARTVMHGHPYVPHNRRVLTAGELAVIRAFTIREPRVGSRCGAYVRGRGLYQWLYDRTDRASERAGRQAQLVGQSERAGERANEAWLPCRALLAVVDSRSKDDVADAADAFEGVVAPGSETRAALLHLGILDASARAVLDDVHAAATRLRTASSLAEARAARGVLRRHFDMCMDMFLIHANEFDWL